MQVLLCSTEVGGMGAHQTSFSTQLAHVSRYLIACMQVRALLCSTKAGGVGLNLTCASRVILTDVWWNCATEDQVRQLRLDLHRSQKPNAWSRQPSLQQCLQQHQQQHEAPSACCLVKEAAEAAQLHPSLASTRLSRRRSLSLLTMQLPLVVWSR